MRFLVCSTLVLLLNSFVYAQNSVETLLQNPSVTWAAEFNFTYDLSLDKTKVENYAYLTKFFVSPDQAFPDVSPESYLPYQLLRHAVEGYYECFETSALKKMLHPEDINDRIYSIDTVLTFDPATMEEEYFIVKNELDFNKIRKVATRQILYFDNSEGVFKTRLLAIAPIATLEQKVLPSPLFWIKTDVAFPEQFNIHKPEISWGNLIYTAPSHLDVLELKVLKNVQNQSLQLQLFEQAKSGKRPIEAINAYGEGQFLAPAALTSYYQSADTIVTFNPETYEEKVQIVERNISPEDISRFRLVQEWYFDEKQKAVYQRLKAIVPVVKDEAVDGTFTFDKGLYFIRFD